MLVSINDRLWELKESAKWSLDVHERKQAIRELANTYGPEALKSIAEIRDVAAYGEIRKACIEAIKSASKGVTDKKIRKSNVKKAKKHTRKN